MGKTFMARIFVEEENRELAERLLEEKGLVFDIDEADRFLVADENIMGASLVLEQNGINHSII